MLLTAVLLLSGAFIVAVQGFGYRRGRYDSEFWRLPLHDKLNRIAQHRREWWWISIWEVVGLFLLTGGIAGLTTLLAEAGVPELAFVGLGFYAVALISWVFGVLAQTALPKAARQQVETGETPDWIHGFWDAAYVAEGAWVLGTNTSYAIIGAAILQVDGAANWVGWTALVLGLLIVTVVVATRAGFPQLAILVPTVLGIALIMGSL